MVNLELSLGGVLAQVNFGSNSASLLGIFLMILALVMPLVRGIPARSHDTFFSVAAVISGFILIFQGWRLDPILQFGQLLLVGITIFYTVESIQIRRSNRP
ncbi:Ycf66 family protein [Tolypothrix campylonemoides VB511288_2]|uniref:Uncharacterized protein n=3 Tax=Nostocales TaxID=1161 RepID=A0A0C1QUU5_9CYAN|nr:Ycf66 family protein [Tolypothrix bouteillei]KAF3884970.1 hypothetical protein DA73_0400005460 [Tolypothrix bouteillei VB521301]